MRSRRRLSPVGQPASHGLPFELHRLIIHASDIPTLATLARVSKAFHYEAIPLLYAHVSIDDDDPATPMLTHLIQQTAFLRHIETFNCVRSSLLQGQRTRKNCLELWNQLLTQCPKLHVASWIRAADDYYVGLAGEMIRLIDKPGGSSHCPVDQPRRFEWHLYGEVHEEMVARLTSLDMDLVSAHITVTPGSSELSVDKIERILPALWEAAPNLTTIHINVGYNLLEIGSRMRRMDRARAFQALTTRLQEHASLLPDRKLTIAMAPSSHIFPTSVDAVDQQLPSMVQADFEKLVLQPRSEAPPRSSAPIADKCASDADLPHLRRLFNTIHL
ncbi:unnamed protein product [Tilletia controversa]|uniref:F-box domain-containing protein n=3 Tax=Tilletia TaxID=13289 RepID=A0A8X7MU84_9BASI|nr:hypothetical protein CF336_g3143 [Tilletia laevis]KAE8200522.1 hypothetical protein CF328_g2942 [Tilletia controversa]KAE8264118.1 hypothetical protein A4X03_0g1174 [Tilletia caries]KAE8205567.1 hypothetical protein CF335_g2254 [Tilletia laevis]KAE8248467.1 hypothetical protein A4X06_0g3692 [Tilletia controversa]